MRVNIVLIADAHAVVCQAIHFLLTNERDMEVVSRTTDGQTAISLARQSEANIIIVDTDYEAFDFLGICRLAEHLAAVKIMAISACPGEYYVRELLAAGVSGIMLRRHILEEFAGAVHTVLAGGIYVSSAITETVSGAEHKDSYPGSFSEPVLTNSPPGVLCSNPQDESTGGVADELLGSLSCWDVELGVCSANNV